MNLSDLQPGDYFKIDDPECQDVYQFSNNGGLFSECFIADYVIHLLSITPIEKVIMSILDIRDTDESIDEIKFDDSSDRIKIHGKYLMLRTFEQNIAICKWDDFDNFIKACYKARELAEKEPQGRPQTANTAGFDLSTNNATAFKIKNPQKP